MKAGLPIVLYDEGCPGCAALATWIGQRGIAVAPIGSPSGALWLRDLTQRERYAAVHAIDATGRRFTGGAAVPVVLAELPGAGRLARAAHAFPAATDRLYRTLARHRRLLARLPLCHG